LEKVVQSSFCKTDKRRKIEVLLGWHWNTMVLVYFGFEKNEVPNRDWTEGVATVQHNFLQAFKVQATPRGTLILFPMEYMS
jgi:hypothetical protein